MRVVKLRNRRVFECVCLSLCEKVVVKKDNFRERVKVVDSKNCREKRREREWERERERE